MSKRFRPCSLEQAFLLPPSLQDWLPEDHLARFVADVAETLDLSPIYGCYQRRDGRGQAAYHPLMMVRLLLYAYCMGRASSRAIEKSTYEDLAFRYLAADQHPDHDTIAAFRKQHLGSLAALFAQILELCRQAGLVQVGAVMLDGTKMAANASRSKSSDYGELQRQEKQIEALVEQLLAHAGRVDEEEDVRYGKGKRGDELPAELADHKKRLERIRQAKAELEQRAKERAEQARCERGQKLAAGETPSDTERKRWSRAQQPVEESKAQYNFTDPDSQLMKDGQRAGWMQGFNAQAAVLENQIIVAAEVTTEAVDKQQLVPMAGRVEQSLGVKPPVLLADTGYWSEAAVSAESLREVSLLVPPDRSQPGEQLKKTAPNSEAAQQMREKLRRPEEAEIYRLRKQTIEPVFGQIKEARGFRRFWLRGLRAVRGEWKLICLTHNLRKLFPHWKELAGLGVGLAAQPA
jgi:transposase